MDTKFIFVTGGVVSGLGKGITAASLGRLLKARGLKVTVMKLDPYLNVDPGTMNPMQHGEVFVTDDGAETDLDLGHYERFIDESLSQNSNLTSGRVFFQVISDERKGIYGGQTIQVIPHITNEIKRRIALNTEADVVFVEIGGTVGDIEGQPFLEAIRQFAQERGRENCMFIHVTLIPYLNASMELKTKPTQHSVKELLGLGIRPDVIVCRCEHPIDQHIREKIALFCNVPKENVIENRDMPTLYEIPLALEKEGLAEIAVKQLHLKCGTPDLTDWAAMVERSRHLEKEADIALVGKYVELHDSYLSVAEALKHGGIQNNARVHPLARQRADHAGKCGGNLPGHGWDFGAWWLWHTWGGWKNPGGKICAGAEASVFWNLPRPANCDYRVCAQRAAHGRGKQHGIQPGHTLSGD